MKIFLSTMKYDYGNKERGYSYEYYNIYLPLCDVYGFENIFLFDFYSEFKASGKPGMNKRLFETIKSEKPDVALFCLFQNEFDEEVINSLKDLTRTCVYFFDDPWRLKFVRHWIKYFKYFSTPDFYMYRKYKLENINNVFYSPFGFNSNFYKKVESDRKYEVSFVGGYSPLRKWIINNLRNEGINVKVFGRGWDSEAKWISQEQVVEVFNQSKINLNLSNAVYNNYRFILWSLKSLKDIKQLLLLKKTQEQVKGRHYEINGCGGFQLSYFVPGLNLAYEIDKEIAVYEDINSIAGLVKFFLKDEELRYDIAESGYIRSHKDHSAQRYLKQLINNVHSAD